MTVPDYCAKRVIAELGIESPKDLELLELIVRERGVIVQDKPLQGAEARIAILGRNAIISISSAIKDPHRRRFGIAHELGHFEMHRSEEYLAMCTHNDLDNWSTKQAGTQREREANEFAAALLLPEAFFAPRCKSREPSLEFAADLAHIFNVSLTATILRYLQFTEQPCAVVFAKDGYIKWFRSSKPFDKLEVFLEVKTKPDPASRVASFFQGHPIAKTQIRAPLESWLTPGNYRRDATLLEQSWPIPSYNAVLTLLWIDDDIENDFDSEGDRD